MSSSAQSTNLLYSSLTTFYEKNPEYRKIFFEIVTGASPLSLRIIDWFVTHFAKTQNVIYWIDDKAGSIYEESAPVESLRKFNLFLEYKAQLKSYTKLHFDPFRRHQRVSFTVEPSMNIQIETTVGQLNFFRWALQNHVIDYIQNHSHEIQDQMTQKEGVQKIKTKTVHPPSPSSAFIKAHCYVHFD
jgi:hypothetical protein